MITKIDKLRSVALCSLLCLPILSSPASAARCTGSTAFFNSSPIALCDCDVVTPGFIKAVLNKRNLPEILLTTQQNCPALTETLTDLPTGSVSSVFDAGDSSTTSVENGEGGGNTASGGTSGEDSSDSAGTDAGDSAGTDGGNSAGTDGGGSAGTDGGESAGTEGGDSGGNGGNGGANGNNGGGNGSEGASPGRGGGANNDE